jgi:hypothetical protein
VEKRFIAPHSGKTLVIILKHYSYHSRQTNLEISLISNQTLTPFKPQKRGDRKNDRTKHKNPRENHKSNIKQHTKQHHTTTNTKH